MVETNKREKRQEITMYVKMEQMGSNLGYLVLIDMAREMPDDTEEN